MTRKDHLSLVQLAGLMYFMKEFREECEASPGKWADFLKAERRVLRAYVMRAFSQGAMFGHDMRGGSERDLFMAPCCRVRISELLYVDAPVKISTRTANALFRLFRHRFLNKVYLDELEQFTERDILSLNGMGKKSLSGLKKAMEYYGLKFKES